MSESAPSRNAWSATAAGLAGSCLLLVVTLWLIGHFLKQRPVDLLDESRDFGDVAADVLHHQGLPTEAIEVHRPVKQLARDAHFYRTGVAAYLPASQGPDEIVAALERAFAPRRIILAKDNRSETEQHGVFTLNDHVVGEVTVHHTRLLPTNDDPAKSETVHVTPADAAPENPAPAIPDLGTQPILKIGPSATTVPAPELAVASTLAPGVQVPEASSPVSLGESKPSIESQVALRTPRVALIIDDGGYGGEPAERILALNPGLTLSILPNTPHGTALAEEAKRRGFEVMLHMPMENTSPTLVHPGQLDGRMDAAEIHRLTQAALSQVPGAAGINNHTGSKFTADAKALGRFMEGIRDSGLFFVDSRTTPESVAYEVARQFQIPAAERAVFLDDERDKQSVESRVMELISEAKTRGAAIGIGHFRLDTAKALERVLPQLAASGVELVHASELAR